MGKRGPKKKANGTSDGTTTVASTVEAPEKRKRGRPPKPKIILDLSNIPAETVVKHWGTYQVLMREQETLKSKIKAAKAAAKADGVDPADLAWRWKQGLRAVEEIDAETRRRNRFARYTALPIGGMLGLFDEDTKTSVATKVADDLMARGSPRAVETEDQAELGGYHAADDKTISLDKNPFTADDPKHAAWRKGFTRRVGERAPADAAAAAAASKTEPDAFEESALTIADRGGYKMHEIGHERIDNTYSPGDPRHAAWDAGFCRRAKEKGVPPGDPIAPPQKAAPQAEQPTA